MRYFQQSELNHTYIVIVKGEGRRERDELGVWDWEMQIITFRMDKQQP